MEACSGYLTHVHHVGSTAIPGIAAKPVIDIMGLLRRHEDGFACVSAMAALGYKFGGEAGVSGRQYFVKGEPRTHHVHMDARRTVHCCALAGWRGGRTMSRTDPIPATVIFDGPPSIEGVIVVGRRTRGRRAARRNRQQAVLRDGAHHGRRVGAEHVAVRSRRRRAQTQTGERGVLK
jgi:GrpB-like predicted nucleotidyltransferase (UPF0157 family)